MIYCNEPKFGQKHKILTSRIMLYVLGIFFQVVESVKL